MYVMENDRVLIDYQSDVKRPLASVLKIILAIELAEQAAEGRIDMNEAVPLDSLRRFYIPGTDGGAHPSWLDALGPAVTADGTVSLMEAAKGMIHYSPMPIRNISWRGLAWTTSTPASKNSPCPGTIRYFQSLRPC